MRIMVLLVVSGLLSWVALAPSPAGAGQADPGQAAFEAEELLGRWRLDLRPTPDAEPYHQLFEVTDIDGNRFSGSFYGTPFEGGTINSDWGSLEFAFSTADGRTPYHHSGVLEQGVLRGRTHAPERGFLSIWSGERMSDPARR